MKRELALQLLKEILPDPPWDEERFNVTFSQLEVLADLKYNYYEMYQPGRLFFENLYAWLCEFKESERTDALEFVHNDLIFISRIEFQQLAQIVYNDHIRQRHLDLVSAETGIPRFRVKQLAENEVMKRVQRASLYVAMSDGARIDYFRRQNLDINNEQVLPSYEASRNKIENVIDALKKVGGVNAKFECLFLIDDFSASGKTLLREETSDKINFTGSIIGLWDALRGKETLSGYLKKKTKLKGSLIRLCEGDLVKYLGNETRVFFCPLLTTEYAVERLKNLIPKIPNKLLKGLEILPGAVIPQSVRITSDSSTANPRMTTLCEKYYTTDLEDEHTGNVMFGYDRCGLPVVLHHNTPNNSIYLLWARKWKAPLFTRYERHGR